MKNTCPKCDTAYNVSASVVGRKFTCKNCGTPVVVTADGLDYQNPPSAAPAAAPVADAGGAAFDFDAPAAEVEDRKPAKAAKPAKPAKSRPRDDEEDEKPPAAADDEFDSPPQRKPKKRGGEKSLVKDFLFFREFIAPIIVKVIFILSLIGIVLSGLIILVIGVIGQNIGAILGSLVYLVIGVPLNMLISRIMCELILLGFAAYDRLGEIKALLEKSNPPAPPTP